MWFCFGVDWLGIEEGRLKEKERENLGDGGEGGVWYIYCLVCNCRNIERERE